MCRKKPKYNKVLIEDFKRKYSKTVHQSPYNKAWCFSKLFFLYVTPILKICTKTTFEQDMNYQINDEDKMVNILEKFEKNWTQLLSENQSAVRESYYNMKKPNFLMKCVWRTYKMEFIITFILTLIMTTFSYANTIILFRILRSFSFDPETHNVDPNKKQVIILVCVLVTNQLFVSLIDRRIDFEMNIISLKTKSIFSTMIFKKALKKPLAREKQFSIAKMIT